VAVLFQDENRHMLACRQGKLLYLVGQALEELALYPQADEVYSLAMLQELSAAEKADLEVRQAKVLLARNDLQAAEKLLVKARDSRRKHPQAGEIYHLSGRLREMQERKEEALSFYGEACRRAIPEVRAVICESKIKLLLRLGRLQEADDTLTKYQQQNLLETGWGYHLREEAGDSWRRLGHPEKAAAAYLLALGSGAPKGGKEAQSLHLRLGDSYLRMGQFKQALVHYQQALTGPDQLFRQSAEKGFRQAGIEQSLAELKPITRRVEPGGVNR
jgi:tetratricopeptide (TPR) repeat protein